MPNHRFLSAVVLAVLCAGAAVASAMPVMLRVPDDGAVSGAPRPAAGTARLARRFAVTSLAHGDTTLNDPSIEPPYANQWDPSVCMLDTRAVAVWYDNSDPQRMQWAFSADSGKSFTDRGVLSPPTAPLRWGPDGCLALDEKTGRIWVAAQVGGIATQRAIGVSRGTFVGDDVAWEPPVLARSLATQGASVYYVPMVALAADSSNGTLHLLFAEYADAFGFVTPFIRYQRSTDEGQTWSSPLTLSGPPPGIGASQPRLAIPAPGVVLATWLQDPGNGALEIRWRRSADAGMSFGPEGTAAQPAGLGGGFPAGIFWSYSLTAERRPNALAAGRAVIAYTESWVTSDETFPDPGSPPFAFEVEPNDSAAIANPFVVGDKLLGDLTQGTDPADAWSTTLAAGEGIQLWLDQTTVATWELTLCSSNGTPLVASSSPSALPVDFRAPVAGTYVVRVRGLGNFGAAQAYRVRTRASLPAAGESRDHADVALVTLAAGAAAWSSPIHPALTPVGYADVLPDVHAADDGHLYLSWWDTSLDPNGLVGQVRLARDVLDPGTPTSVVITEAATNRGIYGGVARTSTASVAHRLMLGISDGRYGNPDVRAISIPLGVRFESFTNDTALPRERAKMLVTYRNANPYFTEALLTQRVRGARNWPAAQIQRANLAPYALDGVGWLVTVRDTAAPGPNPITHSVFFGDSAVVGTCVADLRVLGCDTLHVQDASVGLQAPTGVTTADLDLDGHLDLVMSSDAGPFSGLSFALNDGEGGFQPAALWGDGEASRWPVATDLTGDGYPDLVEAVGQSIRIWVNLSTGSTYSADYEWRGVFGLPSGDALFVVPGDFDEDGITDFVVTTFTSPTGWVWLLRGNGSGGAWDETFAAPVQLYSGGRVNSVAIGDFNEDGIADLVFASPTFLDHALRVMLGNGTGGKGDGTFAAPVAYAGPGPGALNPATGDFNEDGITDVALIVAKGFLVYLGNGTAGVGDGTFGAPSAYGFFAIPAAPQRLVVADVTLDGRADLVATSSGADKIMVMAGGGTGPVGDGTFAISSVRAVGDFPVALAVGDFVDDGIPNVADVAVANHLGNSITIVRGLCDGTLPFDLVVHEPDASPGPVSPELVPSAWLVGSEQAIRWTAGAAIGAVDVELSRDGGTGWERLASGVIGTEFRWTVTGPGTETAVIRVRDSAVQGWSDATTSPLRIVAPTVAVDAPGAPRRAVFALASPNPAHGEVAFTLALPRAGELEVEVFDVTGARVATLARGAYRPGVHPIRWSGEAGRGAGPGVYFVRARGEGFAFTRRVVRR